MKVVVCVCLYLPILFYYIGENIRKLYAHRSDERFNVAREIFINDKKYV